jgi:hypothetical protein
MPSRTTPLLLLLLLFTTLAGTLPAGAQPAAQPTARVFLPALTTGDLGYRLGVDLRSETDAAAIPYVAQLRAPWVRAGDILWASVEPVRGGGYRWETMAHVEANIARLRARGIEPILIVQQSPAWAQIIPNELCSPMRGEYVADFTRFLEAMARRYADGPLRVNYWQIWNEVDYAPGQVKGNAGVGCWANSQPPYYGGDYYGSMLQYAAPAIRAGNPHAVILAAGFAHFWPDDTVTRGFLRGMLASGAGDSFDILSFHAYGTWGALDRLHLKTISLREVLAEYGLHKKQLFADEIGATCYDETSCPPNFIQFQSDYAARIYALALALDLMGGAWYTLVSTPPGFLESQLIDNLDGTLTPRPGFYALRHSIQLLQGAVYIGPPLDMRPEQRPDTIHRLTFRKGANTLYIFWVPEAKGVHQQTIRTARWAKATCTNHLEREQLQSVDCSDADGDGIIRVFVDGSPHYVEVSP